MPKAFISYAWEDVALRAIIEAVFSRHSVTALFDKTAFSVGKNLSKDISENLNDCDCVVAILTRKSLGSPWVLEELIRAQERGIKIFPVVHETREKLELPSFINPLLRVPFKNASHLESQITDRLLPELEKIRSAPSLINLRKRLQSLINVIDAVEKRNEPVRLALADKVLEGTAAELSEIADDRYTIDLGIESNFLMRARPIFNKALEVRAVSLDKISGFWVNPAMADRAAHYIFDQSEKTTRLFVFSSPDSAHRHANILEAHHKKYGSTGAVLLCSIDSYEKILRSIVREGRPIAEFLNIDFAVLSMGINTLLAKLDTSRLHFHEIELQRADADFLIHYDSFVDLMTNAGKTPFGNFYQAPIGAEYRILRWSSDFLTNRSLWGEKLTELFRTTMVSRDVYHMVHIARQIDTSSITNLRKQLENAREASKIKFEAIWLGKRVRPRVTDGVFQGRIDTGNNDDLGHLVLFHFSSLDDLKSYYSDPGHSDIRRELFSAFHPDIKTLYQRAIDCRDEGKDAAAIYEEIEQVVRQFLQRYDFVVDERIVDVVMTAPYPFNYPNMPRY